MNKLPAAAPRDSAGHLDDQPLATAASATAADPITAAAAAAGGVVADHSTPGTQQTSVRVGLLDVCSQPDCHGLFAFDLVQGEAAMYESEWCRLHVREGGEVAAWVPEQPEEEAADADEPPPAAGQPSVAATAAPVSAAPATAASAGVEQQQPVQSTEEHRRGKDGDQSGSEADRLSEEEEDDDDNDEEASEARRRRRAAAAEAAAAEAAAHAAAEAEAAALAAARARVKPPKPVAAAVAPRLFVISGSTGNGSELVDARDVKAYATAVATLPGSRHNTQPLHGAAEPGTLSHAFISYHPQRCPELEPLALADATRPVPVASGGGLPALRRPWTVAISRDAGGCAGAGGAPDDYGRPLPALGLRLPQATAILPPAAAAAGSVGAGTLRVVGAVGNGGGGGTAQPVMVIREVVELPVMTAEQREAAEAVLAGAAAEGGQATAVAAVAQPAVVGPESGEAAPADDAAAEVQAELAGVLEQLGTQVQQPVMDQQWVAPAADKEEACEAAAVAALQDNQSRAEAAELQLEQAAAAAEAEAAASRKVKRPWPKREGPFDHTPKQPQPGSTLRYFEAEEGLIALRDNALLRGVDADAAAGGLSPRAAAAAGGRSSSSPLLVQPASTGRQYLPGVYLAPSTQLSDDHSIASRLQRKKQGESELEPGQRAGGALPPLEQQQQQQQQEQQQEQQHSAALDSSSSPSATAMRLKSHAFDVYCQPRGLQPPLPPAHLQVRFEPAYFNHNHFLLSRCTYSAVIHPPLTTRPPPKPHSHNHAGCRRHKAQPALPLPRVPHPPHHQHQQRGPHQVLWPRRAAARTRARPPALWDRSSGQRRAAGCPADEPRGGRGQGGGGAPGGAAERGLQAGADPSGYGDAGGRGVCAHAGGRLCGRGEGRGGAGAGCWGWVLVLVEGGEVERARANEAVASFRV